MKAPIFNLKNCDFFVPYVQTVTSHFVIHRFMSPQMIISNQYEKQKNRLINDFYPFLCSNQKINAIFQEKIQLNNIGILIIQEICFYYNILHYFTDFLIHKNDSKENKLAKFDEANKIYNINHSYKGNYYNNSNTSNNSDCSNNDDNNSSNSNNNCNNDNNNDTNNQNTNDDNNKDTNDGSNSSISNDDNDNNDRNNSNNNRNSNNDDDDKNNNTNSSKNNKFKDNSRSRKSSVAIFFPSIMMSRMSDDLLKSSQELLYSKSNLNESSFNSSSSINYTEAKVSQSDPIVGQKFIKSDQNFKSSDNISEQSETEDEFDKIFMPVEEDHLIQLEECQSFDENLVKNSKKNDYFNEKDDLTLLFNNEPLQEGNSLLDSNNSYLVDEGPFTMDCIKVSETMNEALENLTTRRKQDVEPFCMKMRETTSNCKEKIENSHKKYNTFMKSKFENIKNNHKTNLKVFKEKESIIHYKLNEIDSSFSEMNSKFENIQSYLREEIRKNKIFLEKKINELRESLKYAY